MKKLFEKLSTLSSTPPLAALTFGGVGALGTFFFLPGPFDGPATFALGTIGWIVGFSLLNKDENAEAKPVEIEVTEVEKSPSLTDELREQLIRLKQTAKLHVQAESPLVETINQILADTQELFNRIQAKQESQAHRMAAVNYTHTLKKLNRALSKEYYIDILKNPRLWESPEERKDAVQKATEATARQLLRNIKQVNSSQDIDFEMDLEVLSNEMEAQVLGGH